MAFIGYLKQSTTVTVTVGPLVAAADGDTEQTGKTVEDTDFYLSKNGAAKANPADTSDATEDAHGIYRKQIDTDDTDTLGRLSIYLHFTDSLYLREDYMVLPANIFDSWFSTDKQQVDVAQILGTAVTEGGAGRLAAAFIKLFDVVTPVLVASDVMRGTDGANTTVPDAAGVAPTAAENADAVWEEAIVDHDTGSTFGGKNQKVVPSETLNDYKATGFSTHSAGDAADAVWEEAIVDHDTGTTFGGKNQKVVPSETINDYKATGFAAVGSEMDLVDAPNATAIAAILAAFQADGTFLASLIEALAYKMIIENATGSAELHNAADVSQGTVANAFTEAAGFTKREKLIKP